MRKNSFRKRFGLIQDTREVECPFAPGIFFTLRRPSHPEVVAFMKQAADGSPLVKKFGDAYQRAQTRLALAGKGGKVDREAIAAKVCDDESVDLAALNGLQRHALERFSVYVESWRGLDDENGEPLPFS